MDSPIPKNQRDLRKGLGLANYLHKYSEYYADMDRPLTDLLQKDIYWCWDNTHADAFWAIKESLLHAPISALPNPEYPFSVICDASDFAIGSNLLQIDNAVRERVIEFESRQLKDAEKNYPVHDKALLAMKYALVKSRVNLIGFKPFVIYTDHASLRTVTQSPHLSQRMARRLSYFAEYNSEVKYKPRKQNVLADALSRHPDYKLAHVTTQSSFIEELIRGHIHRIINVWHCFMPLGRRSTKPRTVNYRHACGPTCINIPSIVVSCAIAQMLRIPLVLLYRTMMI